MKHIIKKGLLSAGSIFFALMVSLVTLTVAITPDAKTTGLPVAKITQNVANASDGSLEVGRPVELVIPKIKVDANILHIGLTKDGAVGAPEDAKNVSWFDLGARPGQQGSAVISGHYGRWKNGTDSVFNLLDNLKAGDAIQVKDDKGITRTFMVKDKKVYGKNEIIPEIFNKSDNAYLNIIACHGQYLPKEKTYSQRLVVFAQLQQ